MYQYYFVLDNGKIKSQAVVYSGRMLNIKYYRFKYDNLWLKLIAFFNISVLLRLPTLISS